MVERKGAEREGAEREEAAARAGALPGTRRALLQGLALLLAVPLLARFAAPAPAALAQDRLPGAPDLSGVTTKAAARKLAREGKLVEISLFPTELGGPEDPANKAFVTPEGADARALAIGTLRRFLDEGLIDHLEVVPGYRGESVVPYRITMIASHSARDGEEGGMEMTIAIW